MYYLFNVYESVYFKSFKCISYDKILLDCKFNLYNRGWYIYKIKKMEKFHRKTSRYIASLIISFDYYDAFSVFLFQIIKL